MSPARQAGAGEDRGRGAVETGSNRDPRVLSFRVMDDDDAPMSTRRDVFELEVVKLLLQVAWADHDVTPEETEALMQRARAIGLSQAHVAELGTYLRGEAPLPPPNLGLLRARRAEVLKHVKRVLVADLHVGDEESEILREISGLLGG